MSGASPMEELKLEFAEIAGAEPAPVFTPKRMSFTARAKKFLLGKTMSTVMGRTSIVKYLGISGQESFDNLISMVEIHSGVEKAKIIKRDTLYLTLQTAILFEDGALTKVEGYRSELALIATAKILLEVLLGGFSQESRKYQKLIVYSQEMVKELLVLFRDSVSPASLTKMSLLFEYFSSKQFIDAMLFEECISMYRETLKVSLRKMLLPFLGRAFLNTLHEFPYDDDVSSKIDEPEHTTSGNTFTGLTIHNAIHEGSVHNEYASVSQITNLRDIIPAVEM